jgi:hypothetical protein
VPSLSTALFSPAIAEQVTELSGSSLSLSLLVLIFFYVSFLIFF